MGGPETIAKARIFGQMKVFFLFLPEKHKHVGSVRPGIADTVLVEELKFWASQGVH